MVVLRYERIRINQDEAHKLDSSPHTLRIVSGTAWITLDQTDMIAQDGQTVTLWEGRFPAVITALGTQPVILEVA